MGISGVRKEENGCISTWHARHSDGVQYIPLNATHITAGVFIDYGTVTKEYGLARLHIRDTTIDRTSR
jgi:hypothetical protein